MPCPYQVSAADLSLQLFYSPLAFCQRRSMGGESPAAWAANDAPTAPPADCPVVRSQSPSRENIARAFPAAQGRVHQSAVIGNKEGIDYVLTVGAIPLKEDDKGEITGEVVYTSYVVPASAGASRPVTFSMNLGGPGAASAYLNLGALGTKHVNFGRDGTYASDSPGLSDNANSWLDFTDLVFIDPIRHRGYSRSHLDEEATVKTLPPSPRKTSITWGTSSMPGCGSILAPRVPSTLIGESYGGYRVPRLAQASAVRAGGRRVRHHHGLPRD